MLAATLKDFNQLVLEDVPTPQPGAGEVVVRIVSCGFCATDYKAITGGRRNVKFPFVPGHEPAGIVAAVGPGCGHFQEGDEVICQPSGFCGACRHCKAGNTHYCEHAFTTGGDGPDDVRPGAFAQYMRTAESCLFHKPKTISFDAAALTEPLSGAWKGVIQYSQMGLGDDVVIIGVGGIGLLCLMVAKAAARERSSPSMAVNTPAIMRSNWGPLTSSILSARNARKRVREILPDGPDLVVEAAGPIAAVRLMVDLRRRGTRWNVFGITTHGASSWTAGWRTSSKGAWMRVSAPHRWPCSRPSGSWNGAWSMPRRSSRTAFRLRTFTRRSRSWGNCNAIR